MPTCKGCGGSHETEALVRHRRGNVLIVHCPDCNRLLGRYRDPGR